MRKQRRLPRFWRTGSAVYRDEGEEGAEHTGVGPRLQPEGLGSSHGCHKPDLHLGLFSTSCASISYSTRWLQPDFKLEPVLVYSVSTPCVCFAILCISSRFPPKLLLPPWDP